MAHSQSFLANQKVRNAIVGAENLLNNISLMLLYVVTDRARKGISASSNKTTYCMGI